MIASVVPRGKKLFFDWLNTIMLTYATNAYYTEHSRVDSSPDFILSPISKALRSAKLFLKLQNAGKRLAATQLLLYTDLILPWLIWAFRLIPKRDSGVFCRAAT